MCNGTNTQINSRIKFEHIPKSIRQLSDWGNMLERDQLDFDVA